MPSEKAKEVFAAITYKAFLPSRLEKKRAEEIKRRKKLVYQVYADRLKRKKVSKMNDKIVSMMMNCAKLMGNLADIQSGKYSDKGVGVKLDEIEFYLAEIDSDLWKVKKDDLH